MLLRFTADYRALFFALVLFPLGPCVALANPNALPWLLPLVFYSTYVAGVLAHNHNHCPVFRSRGLNAAYSIWISAFYGVPTFGWIPTHNQNHHRYLDGPGDSAPTRRAGAKPGLRSMAVYAVKAGGWQLPVIGAYLKKLFLLRPRALLVPALQLVSVLGAHAVVLTAALTLHGTETGIWVYAWSFGVPVFLAAPLLQATNYVQHAGCDPASPDNHSRNFTSPLFNWLFFSNGFHTVHHEHPGTHWAQYRALHEARASRIDQALNYDTPFHFLWHAEWVPPCGAA
jgi:beta-carotene hydroxylase